MWGGGRVKITCLLKSEWFYHLDFNVVFDSKANHLQEKDNASDTMGGKGWEYRWTIISIPYQSPPLWSLAPLSSGWIPCLFLNHTLLCIPILKSQFSINGASLVAQLVKNPPAMWKTWVQSLGWEDPLEKGKATHSSILVWRIPWTIQSMGSQRVGCNWATFTFTFSIIAWQLTLHEIVSSYLVIWWRGIRFFPLYIPREYV